MKSTSISSLVAGITTASATTLLSDKMETIAPEAVPDLSSKIVDGFGSGSMSGNLGGDLIGHNDEKNGRSLRSSLLEAGPGAAVSMINLLGTEGFGADGPSSLMGDSTGISSLASLSQGAMQMSPFAATNTGAFDSVIGSSHNMVADRSTSMFPSPTGLSTLQHGGVLAANSDLEANADHTGFAIPQSTSDDAKEEIATAVDEIDAEMDTNVVLKRTDAIENVEAASETDITSTLRSGASAVSVFGAVAAVCVCLVAQ